MTAGAPFESLLNQVYLFGEKRTDRTGTGTRSLFAPQQLTFDLYDNKVPLVTSKKVPWKMALAEYLWMLSGSTQIEDLSNFAMQNVWSNWSDEDGDIGPTYGAQYRDAGGTLVVDDGFNTLAGVDQLAQVINRLAETPDTRRAVISLWSVPELAEMALEPCMVLFQFSLRGPNLDELHLHIYQRSADMMLGVPFDLFQGGLLAHLVARELSIRTGKDIRADRLSWSAGDVHIYENQIEAVEKQLDQALYAEPMRARVVITADRNLSILNGTFKPEHFSIFNYNPQPAIAAPLAV